MIDNQEVRNPGTLLGRLKGLSSLYPALLLIALVMLADVAIRPFIPPADGQYRAADEYGRTFDPTRPQLIVLGSSRGEQAVTTELLAAEVKRRGLPHQAVNLSIGGGGTPSLLYAVLKDRTKLLYQPLPAGSRIVYLFSLFEMNHLQRRALLGLPTGRDLLARSGMIDPSHWAFRLAPYSSFARMAVEEAWLTWRYPFNSLMQASISSVVNTLPLIQCNAAGLLQYQILPINAGALDHLAQWAGDRLTLVAAPVSSRQAELDEKAGLNKIGAPYMEAFAHRSGVGFDPEFGQRSGLSDDAFVTDCDHISRPEDMRLIARLIVDTLP